MEKIKETSKMNYDIEELLSGIDEFNPEDIIDWGEPVGREILPEESFEESK